MYISEFKIYSFLCPNKDYISLSIIYLTGKPSKNDTLIQVLNFKIQRSEPFQVFPYTPIINKYKLQWDPQKTGSMIL